MAMRARPSDRTQVDDILAPLTKVLAARDLKEVSINEPGEIWLEIAGKGYRREKAPWATLEFCWNVCQTLGHHSGMGFSRARPMVACQLKGGHRFQGLVAPENVISGVAISIRVKRDFRPSWADYGVDDLSRVIQGAVYREGPTWQSSHPRGSVAWLLDLAAQGAPIIVSGGTSTGKTTLINKMILPALPKHYRVITIQDVPELDVPHPNKIELIVPRVFQEGKSHLDYPTVIDNGNRLNPSTLILGELSVRNAVGAIRLLNMGEASFITSIHANTPLEGLDAFRRNIEMSGHSSAGVVGLLARTIGAIVQLEFDPVAGRPYIKEIVSPADLDWRLVADDTGSGSAMAEISTALTSLAAGQRRRPLVSENAAE